MTTPTPNDLSGLYTDDHLQCVITSYGENHHDTPPTDARTVLIDTRTLRNPPDDPAIRARMLATNGLDPWVRRYVMDTPGARELADDTATDVAHLLALWGNPRSQRIDIHVMCGGGRHRSVAIAEEIGARLRAAGIGCEVTHPHINRPITNK